MPNSSLRQKSKSLVNCSSSELQQILKTSAVNLSKINGRIDNFRRWIKQALSLAGFIIMLHPSRASFMPFINSIISLLFDKIASLCIAYKMAAFKQVVQACMLKENISEAMLFEMGQIMMTLNLPETAKETIKEAVMVMGAEATVCKHHHHRDLEWAVQAVA